MASAHVELGDFILRVVGLVPESLADARREAGQIGQVDQRIGLVLRAARREAGQLGQVDQHLGVAFVRIRYETGLVLEDVVGVFQILPSCLSRRPSRSPDSDVCSVTPSSAPRASIRASWIMRPSPHRRTPTVYAAIHRAGQTLVLAVLAADSGSPRSACRSPVLVISAIYRPSASPMSAAICCQVSSFSSSDANDPPGLVHARRPGRPAARPPPHARRSRCAGCTIARQSNEGGQQGVDQRQPLFVDIRRRRWRPRTRPLPAPRDRRRWTPARRWSWTCAPSRRRADPTRRAAAPWPPSDLPPSFARASSPARAGPDSSPSSWRRAAASPMGLPLWRFVYMRPTHMLTPWSGAPRPPPRRR